MSRTEISVCCVIVTARWFHMLLSSLWLKELKVNLHHMKVLGEGPRACFIFATVCFKDVY